MADKEQRTEQPTPRRLEKARREGQFSSSKELLGAAQFLVFVAVLAAWGPGWFSAASETARLLLAQAFRADLDHGRLLRLCAETLSRVFVPLLLGGALVTAAGLAAQLAMTRLGFSLEKAAPDIRRLNPASRLREMSRQNVSSFVKSMVLLPVFAAAVWMIAAENLPVYRNLPLSGIETGVRQVAGSILDLLWKAAGAFVVLGAVDLFRQHRRYLRDLRMSKHEIREEAKEMEGNPQMKMRIRRLQRDLLRRQMMRQVKTATAVIVNPTHYAVAIRYQPEMMTAPKVVAKGKNYLAQRIRAVAVEHQIPLVENPPLSQALYKAVEVGQEIPVHLYRAVAEVLAYIFRLMNCRLQA
jgi:flagellar biosynthetic protein FlhB